MNKKNILVVGNTLRSENNLREWTGIAHPFHLKLVSNDEEAIECCHLRQFDVVLVDATDHSIDGKKLNAVIPILQDDAVVLFYDGEPADKISENIEAVFSAKKYKRILNMIMLEPGDKKWNIPKFSLN